jgi:Fe-S-cluster containining protein
VTPSLQAYLLGGRPVFFPFLSGALTYSCATCEAPCCKGAPLAIGRSREVITIQRAQPRAPQFAVPKFNRSAWLSLETPAERCWFLDKKRRCRLEKVLGRDAKPAGCRLFPFAKLRAAGDTVVVLPDFTCPIQVPSRIEPSGDFGHDELAKEMHRTHAPSHGHATLARPKDMRWPDALLLERRLVSEAEAFLDAPSYIEFCELQHLATSAALGVDGRPGAMLRLEQGLRRFLQIDEQPSRGCVRELVAVTGVLRLMMSSLPRRDVPGVLVALSLWTTVSEHMRGSERSVRTAPSILEKQLPLLWLLSKLEARPILKRGVRLERALAELSAVRAPLMRVIERIANNASRGTADTLEDILRAERDAFAAPLSADAVVDLHQLGVLLLRAGSFGKL